MENRLIKDAQITASSEHDANHAAIQARLNFKAGGGKQGAWSARSNDASQWIQVDLGGFTNITGIATQGRNGYSQWVTKYQLQYSDNGVNFHYYKALCEKLPKVKLHPSDNSQSLLVLLKLIKFFSLSRTLTGHLLILMFRCSKEIRTQTALFTTS